MSEERYHTVEEAADRLRVHAQTVRRWLRAGTLQGTSINRRAGWRIRASEVERFLNEGPRGGDDHAPLPAADREPAANV